MIDFADASAKTKRQHVDDLVQTRSSKELVVAAEIRSRISDKRSVAKLVREVSESLEKYSDLRKVSEKRK